MINWIPLLPTPSFPPKFSKTPANKWISIWLLISFSNPNKHSNQARLTQKFAEENVEIEWPGRPRSPPLARGSCTRNAASFSFRYLTINAAHITVRSNRLWRKQILLLFFWNSCFALRVFFWKFLISSLYWIALVPIRSSSILLSAFDNGMLRKLGK